LKSDKHIIVNIQNNSPVISQFVSKKGARIAQTERKHKLFLCVTPSSGLYQEGLLLSKASWPFTISSRQHNAQHARSLTLVAD